MKITKKARMDATKKRIALAEYVKLSREMLQRIWSYKIVEDLNRELHDEIEIILNRSESL